MSGNNTVKINSNAEKQPPERVTAETLIGLTKRCQERGNRLEVMNGKVYEVQRKLIGEIAN